MKLFGKILLVALVLLLIGYVFAAWTLSAKVVYPESSLQKTKSRIIQYWGTTYEDVLAGMPEPRDFSVKTFDELTLQGKYFLTSDSSTCTLIFPHGWGAIWADMLKYAPAFSDCNCDFVFYDHRVHGDSEGEFATGGINEAKDLWVVTDWVRKTFDRELNQIGWVGSSWGAATSLIAGTEEPGVGFILADSPYRDWDSAVFERAIRDYGKGINLLRVGVMRAVNFRADVDYRDASPMNAASEIKAPVFLIHSQADTRTDSQQSVDIAKGLDMGRSAFYHTEWGNDHVMDVVKNTDDFRRMVNEFLSREAPQFLKSTE